MGHVNGHANGRDAASPLRTTPSPIDTSRVLSGGGILGMGGSTSTLSVRAENVDMAKATKGSLLKLAKEIESDLNHSRNEADHWRSQSERLRHQIGSEQAEVATLESKLTQANTTIDVLAKRVAFHHPRKG